MRNASGHQCKEKMSSSEKKVNKNAYDVFSIDCFHIMSRWPYWCPKTNGGGHVGVPN